MSETDDSKEMKTGETDEQQAPEVRRLQARAGGMLPGIAGIAMFMIFMTILNAFAALRGVMARAERSTACWRSAPCRRRDSSGCCG